MPSVIPTPYPSVACANYGRRSLLLTSRWLPDGESWAGVVTSLYTEDGTLINRHIGARPDREYACTDPDIGCFTAEFMFTVTVG